MFISNVSIIPIAIELMIHTLFSLGLNWYLRNQFFSEIYYHFLVTLPVKFDSSINSYTLKMDTLIECYYFNKSIRGNFDFQILYDFFSSNVQHFSKKKKKGGVRAEFFSYIFFNLNPNIENSSNRFVGNKLNNVCSNFERNLTGTFFIKSYYCIYFG